MTTPEERATSLINEYNRGANPELHDVCRVYMHDLIATEFRKYEERIEGLRKALKFYGIEALPGKKYYFDEYDSIYGQEVWAKDAGKKAIEALSKDDEAAKGGGG